MQPDEEAKNESERKIGKWPRCGHQCLAPDAQSPKIVWIVRHWLRPSKEETTGCNSAQDRQDYRTKKIDLWDGVQRKAPSVASGRITEHVGHCTVHYFVNDDRKNDDGGYEETVYDVHVRTIANRIYF